MPHSDAIPHNQPLPHPQACARAAFVARLKPGAHLLNGQCGGGDDLLWLRAEGYMVTACEPELAQARVASQRSGQAVRVCSLAQLHSVLPYDGIWLSRPLDGEPATLVTLLQPLVTLLKPGAPLCFSLLPACEMSHDQLIQQLVTTTALPLQPAPMELAPMEPAPASTSQYVHQTASETAIHYVMLLRDDHLAP
ncbi:hypothetical protein [Aeromonas sp. MdU4]|uniref:hypothetical protein n=1 Tax=Aeromonas sp. MdU4 TaxID=3342819 RepID=UPI0035BA189E